MTNLNAKINQNGYLWIEGGFNYYDDSNPTTLIINKPSEINSTDISAYETWVEIIRTFNAQTSRDFGEANEGQYEITANNPKGTILTIKIYFIHPSSEDEIATNSVTVQFGINKVSGSLPPSITPETKIVDKAVTDFVIIGKSIAFYNIFGQKVSEGSFNDLLGKEHADDPDIHVTAGDKTAWNKWQYIDYTDLDSIRTEGRYVFNDSDNILLVIKSVKYIGGFPVTTYKQILIGESSGSLYTDIKTRYSSGDDWDNWVSGASTELTGVLGQLATEDSTNLVSAINEVFEDLGTHKYDTDVHVISIKENATIELINQCIDTKIYIFSDSILFVSAWNADEYNKEIAQFWLTYDLAASGATIRKRNIFANEGVVYSFGEFVALDTLLNHTTITTPAEGQMAWNTTTKKPVWYNGANWIYADGSVVS